MHVVTSGVYVPVEIDEHWVNRMWTYSDITNSKVSVRSLSVVCNSFSPLLLYLSNLFITKKVELIVYN